MNDEVALVTNDRWMKEVDAQLDDVDRDILREASHDGKLKVRVMNVREMLESMKNEEPQKFKKLKQHIGKQYGHVIKSMDEFEAICSAADGRFKEFEEVSKAMTLSQACQIRVWRIQDRMTWRAVARAAYRDGFFQRQWHPPSNQLLGIALCNKASRFWGEKATEPPWN